MTLPSFETPWPPKERLAPRIYALEVRDNKSPGKLVAATILVERCETVDRDREGHMLRTTLRLHFRRLRPADERDHFDRRPVFSACYESFTPDGPLIVLTSGSMSNGAVFLDLPGLEGLRIGTHLMNEVVVWAKQWPDANVRPVSLLASQGQGENRERRNRFYEQFGLTFDYTDGDRSAGQSRPMQASALVPTDAWRENIKVVPIDELLGGLLMDRKVLARDLQTRSRALKELSEEHLWAVRRPFRWASRQLLHKVWPF